MAETKHPTDSELDAAIEGTRDMPETSRGAGRVVGPGENPIDPSEETGGPCGSGYPPSRTSGGRIDEDSAAGVEPDEFIKRETAVFEAGTHGHKPSAEGARRAPSPTPGSAEGERDPEDQSR